MNNQVKVSLVGDVGVGKSSVALRTTKKLFIEVSDTTMGASFLTHVVDSLKFLIWDTAGQERYASLLPMYTRGSHIIIMMFDLDDYVTLKNLKERWYGFVTQDIDVIDDPDYEDPLGLQNKCPKVKLVLVGNKSDIFENSKDEQFKDMTERKAKKFAKQISANFYKVSAKTGEGIEEMWAELSKQIRKIYGNKIIIEDNVNNSSLKVEYVDTDNSINFSEKWNQLNCGPPMKCNIL